MRQIKRRNVSNKTKGATGSRRRTRQHSRLKIINKGRMENMQTGSGIQINYTEYHQAPGNQHPEESLTDDEFCTQYLRRVISRFSSLRLLLGGTTGPPYGASEPLFVPQLVELIDVFVPLSLSPYGSTSTKNTARHYPKRIVIGETALRSPRSYIGKLIEDNPELIILGPPGSGKTTLQQYVAVLNAAAFLLKKHSTTEMGSVTGINIEIQPEELQTWRRLAQVWESLGWATTRFPLLLQVSPWGTLLSGRTLSEAFEFYAQTLGLLNCPKGFMDRQLRREPSIVLVDASDGAGSHEERVSRSTNVFEILAGLQAHVDFNRLGNRIVASIRSGVYERQAPRTQLAIWEVDPLEVSQQIAFVQGYYRAFASAKHRAVHGAHDIPPLALLERYANDANDLLHEMGIYFDGTQRILIHTDAIQHRLQRVAENPLFLAIIVSQTHIGYELLAQRHKILGTCIESLVDGWQRFKLREEGQQDPSDMTLDSPDGSLSVVRMLALLGELALEAEQRDQNSGNRLNLLPNNAAFDFLKRVRAINADVKRSPFRIGEQIDGSTSQESWDLMVTEWLESLELDTGLLLKRNIGMTEYTSSVEFASYVFEEYLSAWMLTLCSHRVATAEILRHIDDANWHEIILLYLLLQPSTTSEIADKLLQVLGMAELALLGRILCEVELEKYISPGQKDRIFKELEIALRTPEHVNGTFGEHWPSATILREMVQHEPQASEILERALSDPKAIVRFYAASALDSLLGTEKAKQTRSRLSRIAFDADEGDSNVDVRSACAASISILDVAHPPGNVYGTIPAPAMVRVPNTPSEGFLMDLKASEFASVLSQTQEYSEEKGDYWLAQKEMSSERPAVHIPSFEIGLYPVTNGDYARYVAQGGQPPRNWVHNSYHAGLESHPVTYIDFHDAVGYCIWLTETLNDRFIYRLPTSSEWEWSARGPERRLWPWGSIWQEEYCNNIGLKRNGTNAVGIFPRGMAWCEAQDLAGNVWEWTTSILAPAKNHHDPVPSTEVVCADASSASMFNAKSIILRGGSYLSNAFSCCGAAIITASHDSMSPEFGFRLARVQ